MLLVNTFAGGTVGQTITTANSGGTSGDPWTSVSGSPTYTTATGERVKCATIHRGTSDFLQWSYVMSGRDIWARAFLQTSATPTVSDYFVALAEPGGVIAKLYLTTGNILRLDGPVATLAQLTTNVTASTWVRIEFMVHIGTTTSNGTAELRLYSSAESTTITDSAAGTGLNTGTAIPTLMTVDYSTGMDNFLVDDPGVTDLGWLGPALPTPQTRGAKVIGQAIPRAAFW